MNGIPGVRGFPKRPVSVRFVEKFQAGAPDECWVWRGAKNEDGYGVFYLTATSYTRAHRVAWQLANGPIPAGLLVCHHCDNPPCVNPAHLFLGTVGDNARDAVRKGRYRLNLPGLINIHPKPEEYPRGERNGQSKLTDQDVRDIRAEHQNGEGLRSIARRYGVRHSTIGSLLSGATWRHVE